jgi:hypothetical protein
MVSEDSVTFRVASRVTAFPADYPHSEDFHCRRILRSSGEYLEILGLSSI